MGDECEFLEVAEGFVAKELRFEILMKNCNGFALFTKKIIFGSRLEDG